MELKIHYLEILHTAKLIPLKNATFFVTSSNLCKFQKEKKKRVNIQRYGSFKGTNKEKKQNLKKYYNSPVFVHLHSLSDEDSISTKSY